MTYTEAFDSLPSGAFLSRTFGYMIYKGYVEMWRTPDGDRFEITRLDAYDDAWRVRQIS